MKQEIVLPPAPEEVFVGASITAEVGATEPVDSYPADLTRRMQQQVGPVVPTVIAHPGARVATALQWQFPRDQNLVIVHLATNDFLVATPPATYGASLDALVQRLRAESPQASIVCLGVWGAEADTNRAGLAASTYDAQDQAACQSAGGTLRAAVGPVSASLPTRSVAPYESGWAAAPLPS